MNCCLEFRNIYFLSGKSSYSRLFGPFWGLPPYWFRQLWGSGARSSLDFQEFIFFSSLWN